MFSWNSWYLGSVVLVICVHQHVADGRMDDALALCDDVVQILVGVSRSISFSTGHRSITVWRSTLRNVYGPMVFQEISSPLHYVVHHEVVKRRNRCWK